jgi:2-oxoglutarate dehydrogenase E2 component (dihydrolipoamide succinyltransferase)
MDIKIPEVGESVFEALVAKWLRQDGAKVARDEPLCEIETDKITMEIVAEAAGVLRMRVPEGTTVKIGSVIGIIEEQAAAGGEAPLVADTKPVREALSPPSIRKQAREKGVAPEPVPGIGPGAIAVTDKTERIPEISAVVRSEEPAPYQVAAPQEERVTRKPMTPIRKRIAERLLAARQQTAMLTSFNEADLGKVQEIRRKYGEEFQLRHGVKLGFMSFFVKACCEALREFPAVNARIDGNDIVFQNFYDIGIAVSGEKGLVVPVLRDADRLHFADIELAIAAFTAKIRTNKLAIADLEGGTFTISNGGVFGSLLSTPILNPPQSGVLGMHAIQERPVARDGQIVIRPMMYLALSYDHRIIDGREAVLFLGKVKEYLEQPEEMLLEG